MMPPSRTLREGDHCEPQEDGPDPLREAQSEGEASLDIAVWEAANRRFHRALLAPCAMPRLMADVDDLHEVSARFLFATWRELGWQPRSDDEHRVIQARVRARNVEGATAALENHILAAGRALCALLATSRQSARNLLLR